MFCFPLFLLTPLMYGFSKCVSPTQLPWEELGQGKACMVLCRQVRWANSKFCHEEEIERSPPLPALWLFSRHMYLLTVAVSFLDWCIFINWFPTVREENRSEVLVLVSLVSDRSSDEISRATPVQIRSGMWYLLE